MIQSIRRWYCRHMHRSIMFAGGRSYECATCHERYENPALNGTIKQLSKPQSVRVVVLND